MLLYINKKTAKQNSHALPGFMSSLAVGAYGFGAAIWIPLETTFVNPNNVAAANSTESEGDRYFEDPNVLNRVPSLFLLLGGIFAILQIIGLLFIQEAQDETTTEESTPLLGKEFCTIFCFACTLV